MTDSIEIRLQELGLQLPAAPQAVGSYVPVLRCGHFVITSGQLPFVGSELAMTGKIGDDLPEEQGKEAARICTLNALAHIKSAIGSLERVKQIVRVEGYVHSAPGFQAQPSVVNGASDLLVELFGDAGKHTRIALGVQEMPLNAPVQVAVWAEVTE